MATEIHSIKERCNNIWQDLCNSIKETNQHLDNAKSLFDEITNKMQQFQDCCNELGDDPDVKNKMDQVNNEIYNLRGKFAEISSKHIQWMQD